MHYFTFLFIISQLSGELWSCGSSGVSPMSSTASTPSADSVSEEPVFKFPEVLQGDRASSCAQTCMFSGEPCMFDCYGRLRELPGLE